MRAKRRAFTGAEDHHIRGAASRGIRSATVAEYLGRRESSVRHRARLLGTPFIWTGKGRPRIPPKARTFTEAQDRLIRLMAARGWKSSEVAERLCRNDGAIRQRALSLGVRFIPNGGRSWVGILTSELNTPSSSPSPP